MKKLLFMCYLQLLDEGGGIQDSKKFSLDPDITSFEMLQSLLTKAKPSI